MNNMQQQHTIRDQVHLTVASNTEEACETHDYTLRESTLHSLITPPSSNGDESSAQEIAEVLSPDLPNVETPKAIVPELNTNASTDNASLDIELEDDVNNFRKKVESWHESMTQCNHSAPFTQIDDHWSVPSGEAENSYLNELCEKSYDIETHISEYIKKLDRVESAVTSLLHKKEELENLIQHNRDLDKKLPIYMKKHRQDKIETSKPDLKKRPHDSVASDSLTIDESIVADSGNVHSCKRRRTDFGENQSSTSNTTATFELRFLDINSTTNSDDFLRDMGKRIEMDKAQVDQQIEIVKPLHERKIRILHEHHQAYNNVMATNNCLSRHFEAQRYPTPEPSVAKKFGILRCKPPSVVNTSLLDGTMSSDLPTYQAHQAALLPAEPQTTFQSTQKATSSSLEARHGSPAADTQLDGLQAPISPKSEITRFFEIDPEIKERLGRITASQHSLVEVCKRQNLLCVAYNSVQQNDNSVDHESVSRELSNKEEKLKCLRRRDKYVKDNLSEWFGPI
ncbi:hypothetical protein KCU77_g1529, partial [Aureobasidium melanogenum]